MLAAALVGGLLAALPRGVAAQVIEPDTARLAAQRLLVRAPLLRDSMTVVQETEYVEEVLAFFAAISRRDSVVRIRSGTDAVRALEHLLAPDTVSVRLESDPPGFSVRFYRISDGVRRAIDVRTDTTLLVPAGLYRVEFQNKVTGEFRQQGRVCLQDCRIRWRF